MEAVRCCMGKCSCMAISIKLQKTNSPKIKMPLGDKGGVWLLAINYWVLGARVQAPGSPQVA